jgi:hypothetical protein
MPMVRSARAAQLTVWVRCAIPDKKQRVFAEMGKKLRTKILLLPRELLIILFRKYQAVVIGYAPMNFENLAKKHLPFVDYALPYNSGPGIFTALRARALCARVRR